MKKILTLCLALIGFGLGMQDVTAQAEVSKTEKTSLTKAEELARTLKLDSDTTTAFLKILDKHFSYLERKKDAKDVEKVKEKITMHTDQQMKALLTEEQFAIFKKAIL